MPPSQEAVALQVLLNLFRQQYSGPALLWNLLTASWWWLHLGEAGVATLARGCGAASVASGGGFLLKQLTASAAGVVSRAQRALGPRSAVCTGPCSADVVLVGTRDVRCAPEASLQWQAPMTILRSASLHAAPGARAAGSPWHGAGARRVAPASPGAPALRPTQLRWPRRLHGGRSSLLHGAAPH